MLTKLSLIVAAMLVASCGHPAEVPTPKNPALVVPIKIADEPAPLYMTCWNGLVFVHSYRGGVIQVLSPNGKPLTC